MSQQATIDQQQVVAASSNILRGVYAPAYLHKLAEYGYVAHTEKEAEELLELGFKLAEVKATQPGNNQSKYASAISLLDQHTGAKVQVADHQLKQAAAQLAQDPALYASALVLQEAEKSVQ
jgi:hypothetical protein